jgi:hypothetical protein
MKRLFNVTIQNEIVVFAESAQEAERVAQGNHREFWDWDYFAWSVLTLHDIEESWRDETPYGGGNPDEKTCRQLWEEFQQTPEQVRLQLEANGQQTLFEEPISR